MRNLHRAGLLVLALAAARIEAAEGEGPQIHGLLDLRAVHTDRTRSWLDGGLGKARYGPPVSLERATLLRLAQMSLLVDAPIGDFVSAHVQLNGEADGDREGDSARVDLIQAFAAVRSEPTTTLRLRARLGLFFPPVSQEADALAWTGPYTITPSAATSWIADELRTLGAEGRAAFHSDPHDVAVRVAVFGGNDPTGSLLSWRGFALGDRQTGVSDRPALAPIPSIEAGGLFEAAPRWVQPFREIDGRLGGYVAASYRRDGLVDVRLIGYDNRAEPTTFDGFQYAWATRFTSAAVRVERGPLEVLAQYLAGDTVMGRTAAGAPKVDNAFRAAFGMASVSRGRHRVSVRYDDFEVDDRDAFVIEDDNNESGRAWTAAYLLRTGEGHRLAVEWLRIESDRPVRAALRLPVRAQESLLQASFRVQF